MSGESSGAHVDSRPVFAVLLSIAFCHLLNDMMQSLLPAIYPNFKFDLGLSFGQIGVVTLVYQLTASLLQPLVGLFADRHPMPFSLPGGTLFTLAGLLVLSRASTYPVLLVGASMLGMGSSVFHPESSRVARMASGGRHGLAQSVFQVGGNIGQALGPLCAAIVVVRWGQSSLAAFALGLWYRHHGLAILAAAKARRAVHAAPPRAQVVVGLAVLLTLIFSKYFYLASLTSYYTFYLIERFHLSIRSAQLCLFAFLAAVAVGTLIGGPIGDRVGRKYVIWFSILAPLPFTLLLPYVSLAWTIPLSILIGLILASAFPAIVVYGQELIPGKVGATSGLFFGFAFGMGGLGAALLGYLADRFGIESVYRLCALLPLFGLLAALLPNVETRRHAVHVESAAAEMTE
jgi:FSR family fosmidomycin resistance protein-like MFS transporter